MEHVADLKCPFCGQSVAVDMRVADKHVRWSVACTNYGCGVHVSTEQPIAPDMDMRAEAEQMLTRWQDAVICK